MAKSSKRMKPGLKGKGGGRRKVNAPKPRIPRVMCPDCHRLVEATSTMESHLHSECEAHECELCNTMTSAVIRPNEEGKRLCADCRLDIVESADQTDLETEYDGDEEDEEDESGY